MSWASCDPQLRRWVLRGVDQLSELLRPDHVGTYLHGSLAQGAFYPPKSDVDLLLVVRTPLSPTRRRSFRQRCSEISGERPIVGDLECSVVLAGVAHRPPHPTPFEAHYSETSAPEDDEARAGTSPDLVANLQAVLEGGICLLGAPIPETFGPVDPADFRDAVSGDIDWILEDENIVETPFYGVLNLCRALWNWSGASPRLVPSKDEAGEWALRRLPTPQADVVADALRAYRDSTPITPETRRTAGRTWDRRALLDFRDHFRALREREEGAG